MPETDPAATDPLSLAFAAARRAAGEGEVPVGAAVVRDGVVVAVAHNRPRALRDPTAHAEILAIRAACQALDDERLSGCDLYVTLEPCAMCAAAISFARIRRLYFSAADPKVGRWSTGRASSTRRPATTGRTSMGACARGRPRRCCGTSSPNAASPDPASGSILSAGTGPYVQATEASRRER